MFSSSTPQNPFISSSSSLNVDLSPYIIHHQDPNHYTSLLHHHLCQNQNPISQPTPNSNNAIMSTLNQDFNGEFLHQYGFAEKRRPPKKDKHSKINTSQGLRDRRVRMSVEIARKFFDLQDLLGFDKPSKTLQWLLTKSKKAILELSHENGGIELEQDKTNSKNEKKMKKMKKKTAAVAKELREKARARARERTRVKMLSITAKFNEYSSFNLDPTSHSFHQSKSILLNQDQQNFVFFKDANYNNKFSNCVL